MKRKVVDPVLKNMMKKMSLIKQKSSSYINEKGDLVQNKYGSRQLLGPGNIEIFDDEPQAYKHKLNERIKNIAHHFEDDFDETHDEIYRKKQRKKCRCKK